MARITASLLLLSLLSSVAGAQLQAPGRPLAASAGLDEELPLLVLPRPDLARYRAEDAAQEGIGAYRYGAVIGTSLDIDLQGRWDQVPETGTLVWRAEITSPGAYSLGVLFAEYDLPEGAQLFLYSPDRSEVLGAFTSANEQPNGMLAIRPMRGDRVVLEYLQPAHVVGVPRLSLESIVHDYRDIFGHSAPRLEKAGCLVDINCPAGDPYQDIKQSVVALFAGGFTCSGSILNNTAEDATPYMLTAEHCGNFTNGTFVFNYERPTCNAGIANLTDSLSGAQLVAIDNYVDAQLYLLNQSPPQSFAPFFAGWGRAKKPPVPNVGISHPAGLPRKLSIDVDPAQEAGNGWIVKWDLGQIQGGSSGSALFNGKSRVIGMLSNGGGACGGQTVAYGQFRKFYSRRSLGQWLDPLETGASFIDGFAPFQAAATTYNGSGVNANIYVSTTLPALGTTWVADVDVSAHPGALATIIDGYAGASSGQFFAYGELLVDLGSARFFRSSAGVSGGVSSHSNPIPPDPSFQGAVAYTQAYVIGGAAELTNGVRLYVY